MIDATQIKVGTNIDEGETTITTEVGTIITIGVQATL